MTKSQRYFWRWQRVNDIFYNESKNFVTLDTTDKYPRNPKALKSPFSIKANHGELDARARMRKRGGLRRVDGGTTHWSLQGVRKQALRPSVVIWWSHMSELNDGTPYFAGNFQFILWKMDFAGTFKYFSFACKSNRINTVLLDLELCPPPPPPPHIFSSPVPPPKIGLFCFILDYNTTTKAQGISFALLKQWNMMKTVPIKKKKNTSTFKALIVSRWTYKM
jgi:hypothetical protein